MAHVWHARTWHARAHAIDRYLGLRDVGKLHEGRQAIAAMAKRVLESVDDEHEDADQHQYQYQQVA